MRAVKTVFLKCFQANSSTRQLRQHDRQLWVQTLLNAVRHLPLQFTDKIRIYRESVKKSSISNRGKETILLLRLYKLKHKTQSTHVTRTSYEKKRLKL